MIKKYFTGFFTQVTVIKYTKLKRKWIMLNIYKYIIYKKSQIYNEGTYLKGPTNSL